MKKSAFSRNRHLTLETLEEREMLAVSPFPYIAPSPAEAVAANWYEILQPTRELEENPASGEFVPGDVLDNQWILQLEDDVLTSIASVSEAADRLAGYGITVLAGLGSPGLLLAEIQTPTELGHDELLAGLGLFQYWQPNYVVTATGVGQSLNDPEAGLQWALDTINVGQAWSVSDGTGVVVAVLDSGIALNHPDLKDNIWINTAEVSGDGIDNDGNGFADDMNGWNFVTGTPNVTDNDGHGTHVAGIIGAVAGNGIGVAGAAPGVKILPLKVISGSSGSTSNIVAAMNYLLDLKASGINIAAANMSLGYYSEDIAVKRAVENAGRAGVVVVTSAGNNSKNNDNTSHYPSHYSSEFENAIAVASIDANGQLATNSNYGLNTVDLAAPGVSIYSTTRNGGYGYMSGTSMAAPFVTAAAALLAAADPTLDPAAIKAKILEATDPLSSLSGKVVTGGVLNVAKLFGSGEGSVPKAPTNLAVVSATGTGVTLKWRDNSKNETGFEIQFSDDGGKSWSTVAADIPANSNSRTVEVSSGTVRQFRIRAFNKSGDSLWSNTVSTTTEPLKKPATPSGLKATVSDQEIVVSWKSAANATVYRVERAPSAKGAWEEVYLGSDLSFTDTGLNSSTRYYYRVFAVNINVSSSASGTASATTKAVRPDAPGDVTAVLLDATTVRISWTPAAHATNYRVEYFNNAKKQWVTAAKTESASAQHRNLEASTTYLYRIVAVSGAGESAPSATVQIATPIAVPPVPSGLKGTVVDSTSVELQWKAVTEAASYRIEYSLTGKANDWTTFKTDLSGPSFKATGLAAGLKHYFRVVAENESGASRPSAAFSTTTPALVPEGSPTTVTVEAESGKLVRVYWTAVKNATKYVVERSTNGTTWKKVKTVAALETEVLVSGHKPGTTYYFRVTAASSIGSTVPTEPMAVTTRIQDPAAPRLSVLGSDSVRISWTGVKNATAYRIERAHEDSIQWETVVTNLSADTKMYVDDTCDANTVYQYRIIALDGNAALESAPSKAKSVQTAPGAPIGLQSIEIQGRQVTLGWEETEGAGRYSVELFNGTTWKTVGTSKTNEITLKSLLPSKEYRFRVLAIGKTGTSSPSSETVVTTTIDVPDTPGAPKAVALDADAVFLTWKAAARADFYTVSRYDSVSKTWEIVADNLTETSFLDEGLEASSRYRYRISASNASGTSKRAASANAVTLKASTGLPAPESLESVSQTANSLKIAWDSPETGRKNYRIQWSTDGIHWTSQKTFISSQTSIVVSRLQPKTEYYFRLRIEQGKNVSDWSDEYRFSTD